MAVELQCLCALHSYVLPPLNLHLIRESLLCDVVVLAAHSPFPERVEIGFYLSTKCLLVVKLPSNSLSVSLWTRIKCEVGNPWSLPSLEALPLSGC